MTVIIGINLHYIVSIITYKWQYNSIFTIRNYILGKLNLRKLVEILANPPVHK